MGAVCLSPADALKNACRTTKISIMQPVELVNIRSVTCRRICRASTPDLADLRLESAICLLFTSAFPLTPCRVGRWRSAVPLRRITARLTPSPATANWALTPVHYKFQTPLFRLRSAAPFVNENRFGFQLAGQHAGTATGRRDGHYPRRMRLLGTAARQNNPDMDWGSARLL